jgi:hypothetical protein
MKWWTSSCGEIELQMTVEQASSVNHPGQCDDEVLVLSQHPLIVEQIGKIDKDVLAKVLREYGAWDDEQLKDHDENIQRLVWIAGCDIDERVQK